MRTVAFHKELHRWLKTGAANVAKLFLEIHHKGQVLLIIECVWSRNVNGPHSRTFSEVSSEMFLTGFGKTSAKFMNA